MKRLNKREHELISVCFASGFNPYQVWMMAKKYYKSKEVKKK